MQLNASGLRWQATLISLAIASQMAMTDFNYIGKHSSTVCLEREGHQLSVDNRITFYTYTYLLTE